MECGLTQWHWQYRNGLCIIGNSGSIPYMTFRNRGLKIVSLVGLFVTLPDNFLKKMSPCRVS